MVNEDRVKNLYKIAKYEREENQMNRQIGQYYKSDYVGKEMVKSIFYGTIAYVLMVLLWALSNLESFLNSMNNLGIVADVIFIVFLYIVFMLVYLVATYMIFRMRYQVGRKRLKAYTKVLKTVKKMYDREEKLKL